MGEWLRPLSLSSIPSHMTIYTIVVVEDNTVQFLKSFSCFEYAKECLNNKIADMREKYDQSTEWYENEDDLAELDESKFCELLFSYNKAAIMLTHDTIG